MCIDSPIVLNHMKIGENIFKFFFSKIADKFPSNCSAVHRCTVEILKLSLLYKRSKVFKFQNPTQYSNYFDIE